MTIAFRNYQPDMYTLIHPQRKDYSYSFSLSMLFGVRGYMSFSLSIALLSRLENIVLRVWPRKCKLSSHLTDSIKYEDTENSKERME